MNHSQTITIGAVAPCDVILDDPRVSSRHAALSFEDGAWYLEDLGSSNGTWVEGVRLVGRVRLGEHSRIRLGHSEFNLKNLLARVPGSPGRTHATDLGVGDHMLVLGRHADCDVVIDSPQVSSRHARVFRNAGRLILEDLGSLSGTFVQRSGQWTSYRTLILRQDDVVRIGDKCFHFHHTVAAPPTGARLDVRGLGFTVTDRDSGRPKPLLADVSFAARPGELIGIMGPSGSGKTTLLNILAGFDRPSAGEILLDGASLFGTEGAQLTSMVGHAPQFDVAHELLTVSEVVRASAQLRGPDAWSAAEIKRRVQAALEQVGLWDKRDVPMGSEKRKTLSGGQKKRVNIAMELVLDPPVLLLDEPTSGLSAQDTTELIQLLRRLADRGRTILLTIHQPSYADFVQLDQVLLLEQGGHVAWFGPTAVDCFDFFGVSDREPGELLARIPKKSRENEHLPGEWARRYVNSQARACFVAGRLALPPPSAQPAALVQPTPMAQLGVLLGRALRMRFRDLHFFVLSVLAPAVISVAVIAILRASLGKASGWSPDSARLEYYALLALAIMTCFFGALSAALEIVEERAILRRELRGGMSLSAYVASKALLFALPSVLFPTAAVLAMRFAAGGLFEAPPLPVILVLVPAFFASACAGLVLSAAVASSQSVIVLAVFFAVVQVLFLILADLDVTGLRVASSPISARWAMSGLVTASDLCLEDGRPGAEVQKEWAEFETGCPKKFYAYHGVRPSATSQERRAVGQRLRAIMVNMLLGLLALGMVQRVLRWQGTKTQ